MRALSLCVLLALTAATPHLAHAQAEATSRDRREAKRLFDQAHLAYRRGDYEEAILKWQESYELSKEPLIYESIANAYERLGDLEAAHDYLSKWRAAAPSDEHKELDSRLESLADRLAKKRERERELAEFEEQKRREQEERRRRAEEERRENQRADATAGTAGATKIAGYTLLGVGGAAVVVGIAVAGVAASRRPERADVCEESGGELLCLEDERDTIESSNSLAIAGDVTWIAGAIVAAGGIASIIVGSEMENEPATTARVQVNPWFGARAFGAALHARF